MQQFGENYLYCELLLALQNIKFSDCLPYLKHLCRGSHSSIKNSVTWRWDWWIDFCGIVQYACDRSGEQNQVLPSLQVTFLTRIIFLRFSWKKRALKEVNQFLFLEENCTWKRKATGNPVADSTLCGPWKDAQRHYFGRIKAIGITHPVEENCLLLFAPPDFKEPELGVCLIVNKHGSTERTRDLHNYVSLLLDTPWAKRGNSWKE